MPIRDGESYVLTIQVTGKDVPGETKTFELDAKDGHHFMKLKGEEVLYVARKISQPRRSQNRKTATGKIAFGNFAWRIPQQA